MAEEAGITIAVEGIVDEGAEGRRDGIAMCGAAH